MYKYFLLLFVLIPSLSLASTRGMVLIKRGQYQSFYDKNKDGKKQKHKADYIFEPSKEELLKQSEINGDANNKFGKAFYKKIREYT